MCEARLKENNRCRSPAGPSRSCAAFFPLSLKDNSGSESQHGVVGLWTPPRCTSRLAHKLIANNRVLQPVSSDFSPSGASSHVHISPVAVAVSQPGGSGEDVRNCDSNPRYAPLIRAALWLHTALFTLVSLTHSCPIVIMLTEASGLSSLRPLWPTVSFTHWSRAWFLPRLERQRISAKQKPKQTFTIKQHSWKCQSQRKRGGFYQHIVHHYGAQIRKRALLMSSG